MHTHSLQSIQSMLVYIQLWFIILLIQFGSSSISETVQLVQSSGSSLCCAGNSSILAVPLDNKVYRIDFSPSVSSFHLFTVIIDCNQINHGGRPLVHSILHGHASICKTTAFDEHHLKVSIHYFILWTSEIGMVLVQSIRNRV